MFLLTGSFNIFKINKKLEKKTYIVNLLDLNVSLSGESVVLRLCLDNDQHGVRGESLQVLVDRDVVLVQLRARVVPPNNLLLRSHLENE